MEIPTHILSLLNKLSMSKYTSLQLTNMAKKDHTFSEDRFDIFSDGIDSAEAIIALEVRKVLSSLNSEESNHIQLPTLDTKKLEEYALICAYRKNNNNMTQTARDLGITPNTVMSRIKQTDMSQSVPNMTVFDVKKLRETAVKQAVLIHGKSSYKISNVTNVCRSVVANMIKNMTAGDYEIDG